MFEMNVPDCKYKIIYNNLKNEFYNFTNDLYFTFYSAEELLTVCIHAFSFILKCTLALLCD